MLMAEVPILDTRPLEAYRTRHRAGAVNIPLAELTQRIHELPPPDEPLLIFDTVRSRARWAASRLRARGRCGASVVHGIEWLNSGPTASGVSTGRLWRPHSLLIRAIKECEAVWGRPNGRAALDIASGAGRDAVYLALQGFDVTAWDILPDAIDRCRALALRHGVSICAEVRDVERGPDLPRGAFDLVVCFNFLHRPLMSAIRDAVRPSGLVVYETFTTEQREQFGKPRKDEHLLRQDELRTCFSDWRIIHYQEGQAGPRRNVASLIARKHDL